MTAQCGFNFIFYWRGSLAGKPLLPPLADPLEAEAFARLRGGSKKGGGLSRLWQDCRIRSAVPLPHRHTPPYRLWHASAAPYNASATPTPSALAGLSHRSAVPLPHRHRPLPGPRPPPPQSSASRAWFNFIVKLNLAE